LRFLSVSSIFIIVCFWAIATHQMFEISVRQFSTNT
jgi:hypothetical protein